MCSCCCCARSLLLLLRWKPAAALLVLLRLAITLACLYGHPACCRYMLASLREAALAAGHPEWGHGGPHDSGHYNSHSSETGFFKSYGGSWDTGARQAAQLA